MIGENRARMRYQRLTVDFQTSICYSADKCRLTWSEIDEMSNQALLNRITINPAVSHGKPTIRNLRYSVEFLLELLSSGMTTSEILADYEDLETDDIRAALVYATRLSQVKRIQPV